MDELKEMFSRQPATAGRPLLGMTVLVVEDSRYTCETLRLMCLRSGARIRRADCLASARRHLKVYRPSAVIVDMGLPDGSGLDLIRDLAQAVPRVGVILGMSGDDGAEAAARAAGADAFLDKPIGSLSEFQERILAALPPEQRPVSPRGVSSETIDPDRSAYRDDMCHAASLLKGEDGETLDYVAQFLGGVARSAQDGPLAEAASDLGQCPRGQGLRRRKVAQVMDLVRARIENRTAI
ncbi:MAG: response regulator [Roseovarius sp.]